MISFLASPEKTPTRENARKSARARRLRRSRAKRAECDCHVTEGTKPLFLKVDGKFIAATSFFFCCCFFTSKKKSTPVRYTSAATRAPNGEASARVNYVSCEMSNCSPYRKIYNSARCGKHYARPRAASAAPSLSSPARPWNWSSPRADPSARERCASLLMPQRRAATRRPDENYWIAIKALDKSSISLYFEASYVYRGNARCALYFEETFFFFTRLLFVC